MQLDMHYYGTYAMARAAGLNQTTCKTIATAAQFVDDNAENKIVTIKDGARIDMYATAHHWYALKNKDELDQRLVWVPFHFLPGNEGGSYTEKLLCRKNSEISKQMVEHHLGQADQPYGIELVGITAHVYADTFSHYGFSGIGSRQNRVDNDSIQLHGLSGDIESYIRGKADKFFSKNGAHGGVVENFRSLFLDAAEKLSGALGHGSVATYPDRPYLHWEFLYEQSGSPSIRYNQESFLEGCKALHNLFRQLAEKRSDLASDNGLDFSAIEDRLNSILSVQANCDERIDAWQNAAENGDLFALGGESIPVYHENEWHDQRDNFSEYEDSADLRKLNAYRFYQSAALHRTYVLRDLLPRHGIVID